MNGVERTMSARSFLDYSTLGRCRSYQCMSECRAVSQLRTASLAFANFSEWSIRQQAAKTRDPAGASLYRGARRRFFQRLQTMEKAMKVLMVITSHDQLGNTGRKTGFWLEELAAPYYVFKDAGAQITLASAQGGP